MKPHQNCLESWELTARLGGRRRQCSWGEGLGPSQVPVSKCVGQSSSSLKFSWRLTDGVHLRMGPCPQPTFVPKVLGKGRAHRSQNNLLVSVSATGADSYFVGGLTVAGNGWGAGVIPSFLLTPQRGSAEKHREWRQGVGVKPVLHIAISSSHSSLQLQEVESTAGKTRNRSLSLLGS